MKKNKYLDYEGVKHFWEKVVKPNFEAGEVSFYSGDEKVATICTKYTRPEVPDYYYYNNAAGIGEWDETTQA